MIKTIVFDIGNVLMNFDYMPYVTALLKDEAVIERVNDAIWRSGYWNELDLGKDPEEVFGRMIALAPEHEDAIRRTLGNVGQCMSRTEYAISWISELKERGYQILYLSNYSRFTMKSAPEVLNFLPYMDGGIFSCDEKIEKPDPEIFQRLFLRFGLQPEECVFLDDSRTNVEAAQSQGMKAIHFAGYAAAREELEDLLKTEGLSAPKGHASTKDLASTKDVASPEGRARTESKGSKTSEDAHAGIDNLLEHPVLKIFSQLNRRPRESGNEQAASDWICSWAIARGFDAEQDDQWDLIIRKPASPGYEEHPPVLLQAHMDMVCEKNAGSTHDFATDPIELEMDGEWLVSANGTSLGADDGIGVAYAMAVLEDQTLEHPPLEVVFTVQEESTFAGADRVDVKGLKALRMINLDHSDEGELVVGSCGGTGAELIMPLERDDLQSENEGGDAPEGLPMDKAFRIMLRGLKGGHSGEDIHRGRGNAIMLLMRLLEELDLPVVDFRGGSNRLSIPREAEAIVLTSNEDELQEKVRLMETVLRKEFGSTAPELRLIVREQMSREFGAQKEFSEGTEKALGAPLTKESFRKLCAVLRAYPNGIVQMSGALPGLVESSDNIGIIEMEENHVRIETEVRGAYKSTIEDIKKSIDTVAEVFGAEVRYFDAYVPWEPEEDSPMRQLAAETYRQLYDRELQQIALHAGLECGFFAAKIPGLEIISIGPDSQCFHSPEERVHVGSVLRVYEFLKTLLARC